MSSDKRELNSYLTIFLGILSIVLFIQGVIQIEIIPISLLGLIFGVNTSSPTLFFLYIFAILILRFLFMMFIFPFTELKNNESAMLHGKIFWTFLSDFFRIVFSLFYAFLLSGGMVVSGIIPNSDPPLFFVMLSFFLASFIFIIFIRRVINGDFFDEILGISIKGSIKKFQENEGRVPKTIKKFFLTIALIFIPSIIIFILFFIIIPFIRSLFSF
jgi:hypothetical protein